MSLLSLRLDRHLRAAFAAALVMAVLSPSLAASDSPSSPFAGLELAPAVATAGRSKSYTMDAGSATLALQVNDAVTGTLLAVAFDQRRSGSSTMQWTTSVSNRAAAGDMLKSWAEQLKRELDAARAK
jgi:Protein of unknown function (DUF3313)